ncbi:phosphate system positive regulatory protein pho81, partial [Ascosphaera acerosa]
MAGRAGGEDGGQKEEAKFGKQIQRRQLDLPEYSPNFTNYKALKKLIKRLSKPSESPQDHQYEEQLQGLSISSILLGARGSPRAAPAAAPAPATGRSSGPATASSSVRANKDVFFFRLEREIEKVNVFYLQKEAEFSLRLKTLLDKKRVVQSRRAATVYAKTPAAYVSLFEGFQQFDIDLHKLQRFVEVNATAVSKILKK